MIRYTYPFERLEIWSKALDLSVLIYQITKTFPSEEKFGLTSQLRRSVNSISANISEGSSRFSDKEKARFYEISYGSLVETLNHLVLANKLGFIGALQLDDIRIEIEQLSNKINAYHKFVLGKNKP